MIKRGIICCILLMVLSPIAWGAQFTDTSGHWAEEIIQKWSELGLINGYKDGSFKPENGITRAEFITLINQSLGYQEEESESFKDVKENDWYYKQVKRALKQGYISGYGDHTFRPSNNVSRQEAAVILVRIMEHVAPEKSQYLYRYYDVLEIPEWSWSYLEIASREGYLKSYEDQTIRPAQPITRAETVYALEQILGPGYVKEGRYGPATGSEIIEGNVVISSGGITLRNVEIQGELYLTEGIGDGDVTLDHVIVHGKTRIKGGGTGTISVRDTTLGEAVLQKDDGQITLELRGETTIETLLMHSGGTIDATKLKRNGIEQLMIYYGFTDQKVNLTGTFGNVELFSGDMVLRLNEGEMKDLIIHEEVNDADVKIQYFKMDEIQFLSSSDSTFRVEHSTLNKLHIEQDQNMELSDTVIKTITLGPKLKNPELTVEHSVITTFNIECPIEIDLEETDIEHLNLEDESGKLELDVRGGLIEGLVFLEKADFSIEHGAIKQCALKRAAEDSTVYLSTDSYMEKLKVYEEVEFKGRGDILEANVYADGVSFVETPHQLIIDEERSVSAGNSSYSGSLLWNGSWEETDRNNGRIEGAVHVTLIGDQFAEEIRLYNEIKVNGLPEGLYADVSRLNDTELEIQLKGTAIKHSDSNDISNISVSLNANAFVTLSSKKVKNTTRKNLDLNFHD